MIKSILGRFLLIAGFVGCFSCLFVKPALANVFIANVLGRYVPISNYVMEPGAFEKQLIYSGNHKNVGGLIAIKFTEQKGYYGFSALICDEANAQLYAAKEKAQCFRKEIDSRSDVLKYKFKSDKTYYLFIVNRTRPLSVVREIEVRTYIFVQMTESVKEELKADIDKISDKLRLIFDIEPFNYAVIPCRNNFIPSSKNGRTLTICSELLLADNGIPDPDLLPGAIFWEIPMFLKDKWELDSMDIYPKRLRFITMMIMLFSKDKESFEKFAALIENNHGLIDVLQKYPHWPVGFSRTNLINIFIDLANDPFGMVDHWLQIAYNHMTSPALQQIRDGEYRHYGYLRNSARLVLKRRYELANPDLEKEPENIISDFW